MGQPLITSFVVRLFQGAEGGEQAVQQEPERVVVRHVQSGEERQFQRLDDALAFMKEFVQGANE